MKIKQFYIYLRDIKRICKCNLYDNLTVDSVPEPLSILGSLTAGAFGLALRRKYKPQEQA
ncbi:MAG: PEP-CTERM sorting domain-containing protein [Gloeotrichia echinulata IR180]|jgi:hypothetical protein|nr:PEP-CTERM sorting domain-containing protein [Gloeotrichia echinulata DEX184]